MAKDPRFNFYPDNWDGGTEDFSLEQEGAYLRIIIMQSRKGRFTAQQAVDCLMRKTRGNAAACTGLWNFLMPKFFTDGKFFWSERLEKEILKSKTHSEHQKERADKRWGNSGNAGAMPVGTGTGNRSGKKKEKGVEADQEDLAAFSDWTDSVLMEADFKFTEMEMHERWPENFPREDLIRDHLGLLHRYPNMRPENQQSFRYSLLKHLRENKKKTTNGNITPKGKEHPSVALARQHEAKWGRESSEG